MATGQPIFCPRRQGERCTDLASQACAAAAWRALQPALQAPLPQPPHLICWSSSLAATYGSSPPLLLLTPSLSEKLGLASSALVAASAAAAPSADTSCGGGGQ